MPRRDERARRHALRALAAATLAGALPLRGTAMTAATVDLATDGARWQVVNDGVMGGVSSSRITAGADGVQFSGEVRTEFNGGFASARRAVDLAALGPAVHAALGTEPTGLALVVRGDGHRYRLTVYPSDGRGGVRAYSYYAEFDTAAAAEQSHVLRWRQFRATFRGRAVPDAPPLVWRDVAGLGLMLTKDGHRDGRGLFALRVASIRPVAGTAAS